MKVKKHDFIAGYYVESDKGEILKALLPSEQHANDFIKSVKTMAQVSNRAKKSKK